MSDLNADIQDTKKKYREIFIRSSEEIQAQIDKIKPKDVCKNCPIKKGCAFKGDIFEPFPYKCAYKKWQMAAIKMLDEEISKGVYEKWMKLLEFRKNYKCTGCATCCKLACSEFSYITLKQKALKGDKFAKQFTSIFIPYESEAEAQKVYPEYFKLLEEKMGDERVYFYHCPKLKDNRCTDYENRPNICRNFPENPLSLLPSACGYCEWKNQIEPVALMLHAMLEIIDYYKTKIPK